MLEKLKQSAKKEGESYPEEFDLLIVGGGATGAGVAVDAASRGLKVALVEKSDFSSGVFVTQELFNFGILMQLLRHIFQVHKAGPWRCTVPAKGRHGTRL